MAMLTVSTESVLTISTESVLTEVGNSVLTPSVTHLAANSGFCACVLYVNAFYDYKASAETWRLHV